MAKRFLRIRWLIALALLPAATALSHTEPDRLEPVSFAASLSRNSCFANAGCAASGCHNANGPRGTSGSEFSTWANEDPHSRAYGVLLSEAGQRMERLYRRDPKADASKDQLCLECHAPLGVDSAHVDRSELRSDAVGCAACHGSPEQWRTTHYLKDWKDKGRPGMMATKDLTTRITLCASCHVGKVGMDVDHDLIAAGHPRLFFEYSAYHDLLPRHWQEPKTDTTFHARAWAIGRVTAAKAAVDLLHYRASKPERWPELAQFNCYSCHRELTGATMPPKDREAGSLATGSWDFALLEAIAGMGGELAPPQAVDPKPLIKKLHDINTPPTEIAAAAKTLSDALTLWQQKLARVHGVDVNTMRQQLATQKPTDWEQATQQYLAISALHRSLPASEQRREGLLRLRDMLKFATGDKNKKTNSPMSFDAAKYGAAASQLLSNPGEAR